MSWGAIKLRYRDSKNVFFDGEASPAPGGGTAQAIYSGGPVAVNDGQSAPLTFDSLNSGTELLDRSTPGRPVFLAEGIYSFLGAYSGDALTAGGYVDAQANLGADGAYGLSEVFHPENGSSVLVIAHAAVGDPVQLIILNNDGASARNFQLATAVLVRWG